MEYLAQHIESLIFACDQAISLSEMKEALEASFETQFEEEEIKQVIEDLMQKYQSDQHAFEIVKIAGGYQFLTKGAFHNTVGQYLKQTVKKRLSRAALETLAIIAYTQPATKSDVENIRGVNCDYAVQKLLEKELVTIVGRKDAPGRPLLYGSSQKFLDYFGIQDLKDLPKLKEFQHPDNSIGEAAPIEEDQINDNDGTFPKKDRVIDIAVAVANLIDPLPFFEEEENPVEEHDELPVVGPSKAEKAAEPVNGEENITEDDDDNPPTSDEEGIAGFVQATSGEFAGKTTEELDEEEDLDQEQDNQSLPDSVNTKEEIQPIKED